jgi:Leucine-rich repeat (LRR) protein
METQLQDYFNGICCPAPTFNFDVDSSDWTGGGITDQASFESELGVTTSDFLLSGNNIKANILTTTSNAINLTSKQITNIGYITVSGLIEIYLSDNQIVTFNPDIALPSSLNLLDLQLNQIVDFNPDIALPTSLQSLNLTDNQIVTFNPSIALPSSLQFLSLSNNQIVSFNPSVALPSSLQFLSLSNNQIVTFNPTIALPSSLQFLNLANNQIVSFNPSIALPTSLQNLVLISNQIATFNPTISLPTTLTNLDLSTNLMTTAGYTASESWANGMHAAPSGGVIDLSSNTDSASGTNLETILTNKGWTVIA